MRQSSQSAAARADDSSARVDAASRLLLSRADEAVRRALTPAHAAREQGLYSTVPEIGNQPDSPPDHTLNGSVAAPVVTLPPPVPPARRTATLHALQEW